MLPHALLQPQAGLLGLDLPTRVGSRLLHKACLIYCYTRSRNKIDRTRHDTAARAACRMREREEGRNNTAVANLTSPEKSLATQYLTSSSVTNWDAQKLRPLIFWARSERLAQLSMVVCWGTPVPNCPTNPPTSSLYISLSYIHKLHVRRNGL